MVESISLAVEEAGDDIWLSVHARDGKELDNPRQLAVDGSARFEFDRETDVFGIGVWSAPSGGKWLQYEELALEGIEALTVSCRFDIVVGPDIVVPTETLITEYNSAGDVHPLRDATRLGPGTYTPKLPDPLSPNEPLDLVVEGTVLWFKRAPDEQYAKVMEGMVRGSNELAELHFRSTSGHEVAVIADFNSRVAIESQEEFRLMDIHRLGDRLIPID